MSLFFKVISEASEGDTVQIAPGVTIGRKDCDLTLRDSKASSLHAKVVEGLDGSLLLVDQGSSNGILVDGKKVFSIEIKAGLTFKIGRCQINVFEEVEDKVPEDFEEWRARLLKLTIQAEKVAAMGQGAIRPFSPPLLVEELGGDVSHLLGYGPRKCGNGSADIYFFFPVPEPLEFEISPDEQGNAVFSTKTPQHLRLNGVATPTAQLQDGDMISAVGKRIRIRFMKSDGSR